MSAPQPLSTAIRNEVLTACRTALHYRGDLKSLMLGAGVPAAVYNRYDHLENTKVKIARSILDELQELGHNGWAVQRRIVVELCGMPRPANGVEDLAAGRNALDALRRTAAHEGVIVDTEQAARNDRATRAAQRQQHLSERQQTLDRLRAEFSTLARSTPSTNAERQARGYQLEKLLAELFRANELEYTGSTRQPHEQVDGSFHFRGFTYLVEARWRNQPPGKEDLAGFKLKVDGKLESTRGLFISMAAFDEEVLQYFAHVSGKRNVIYMTGQDLAIIFEGTISLEDALLRKIDAAEKHGRYLINLLD
ncbi:restriction endonuclease [Mycobacterium paragordonae]|uniref:restriction endonuclease n=1 Tax=Mycobacterium paragordonae TaxID=1389713 RepID=UPI0018CC10A6|nr:restriction endonuclease [Mycobacterium paragordonae]